MKWKVIMRLRSGFFSTPPGNTEHFLLNFPEQEFWRFFVERQCYNGTQDLYDTLASLYECSPAAIKTKLHQVTFNQLYQLALTKNNGTVVGLLESVIHVENKLTQLVIPFIEKKRGWIGFEANEAGYLLKVTQGLRFVFNSLREKLPLTLDWIKELHTICTKGIKEIAQESCGKLRNYPVTWALSQSCDSRQGLRENLVFFNKLAKQYPDLELIISVEYTGESQQDKEYIVNKDSTAKQILYITNTINTLLKETDVTRCRIRYELNASAHLEKISFDLLQQLEADLAVAITQEERITAIFTYLKYAVLMHIFEDGVGRTFSMDIYIYLMMRDDLPFALLPDSNVIPGLSVSELVGQYNEARLDVEKILSIPGWIDSTNFAEPNVKTSNLLANSSQKEIDYFNTCLEEFRAAKKCLLSSRKRSASEIANAAEPAIPPQSKARKNRA